MTHFGEYLGRAVLSPVAALLDRAVSLEALGRLDEAVADLDALCGQSGDHDAAEAVTALTAFRERHPAHAGAGKALGHALLEDFMPGRAAEVLEAMCGEHSDDWQVWAWLGMAKVTTGLTEESWNKGFGYKRLRDAIAHLVTAVRLAPDEHYPRSRLRWLVERACVLSPIANALTAAHWVGKDTTGIEFDVADALPELDEPLRNLYRAGEAERAHRWVDSVAELTAARAAVEHAGLPVLTALLDLRLADTYLRRYDVQRALEHLDAAERATPEISMLPDPVREGVDEMVTRTHDAGTKVMLRDIDHLELNNAVLVTFLAYANTLRAQTAHRVGDVDAAVRQWPEWTPGNSFEVLHYRMMVLRDADRVDEAMELLPELTELADPDQQVKVANMAASLHLARKEFTKAADVLESAMAAYGPDSYFTAGLVINLLNAYYGQGRAEDVLALADANPLPEGLPSRYAYARMLVVARALGMLGKHEEALLAFTDALDIIERVRGTLHDEQVRMTWQGTHVHVYEEAVDAALAANQPSVALDLVERSKARAFVDQLGLGPVEPNEQIQKKQQALADARRRLALLNELVAVPNPAEEWGLIHRVNELRPAGGINLDDLDLELTRERAAVDRLAGGLALEPLKGKSSVAAETLSTMELPALLGEGCVLAEYFVGVDDTVLFVMTPGDPVPVAHRIPRGAQRIAEDVGRHLGAARTLDVAAFAADFGPFVAPVVEHCAPGDVVVLVPHGQLHHVPLHALLLDRNPVCHLPSASLLRYRRRSSGDRGWRTALVLGDSRSDLVHARREAVAIAGVFGGAAVVGDDASRQRLVAGLADRPDVVHVACHGRFDGEHAAESALLLAPADTRPDAELSAADVFGLVLSSNLVTLSACESGVSANRPGDELIGLTRAALHAGAPSLVVSLWEVDDLSTELLMTAFYREARAGAALAEALRRAQLALAATTAREVVAHCDAALASSDDPVTVAALLLARAGAEAVAGDVLAALASCRQVSLDGARGAVATRLRAHVTRRLNLLSLKAEVDNAVDYTARPFAHPYHWAAFVLVGDWR